MYEAISIVRVFRGQNVMSTETGKATKAETLENSLNSPRPLHTSLELGAQRQRPHHHQLNRQGTYIRRLARRTRAISWKFSP